MSGDDVSRRRSTRTSRASASGPAAFIRANLRPLGDGLDSHWRIRTDEEELAEVARDREVQRMLFDAGLAGVCVPTEYGGQGLTVAHQRVLNEELRGYEYPTRFQIPTFTPCMAVLLDFGTEEQKLRHVPAMLKGEELWMQFLSEPSGGSDVAGALTTAVRDGDEWILNGSKVWTTGAWWSDWGLCLARTNWDVPKHRGLSVFIFPIDSEGIEVQRIEMLNGSQEFCQEFLTDLRVPDDDRVGEVERRLDRRHPLDVPRADVAQLTARHRPRGRRRARASAARRCRRIARDAGRLDDPRAQELIGEAEVLDLVGHALKRRIGHGHHHRHDVATSPRRSPASTRAGPHSRRITIEFELAGATGAAWIDDDGELGGVRHRPS